MRVALFSDIHGNDVALDAVLDDIERSGGVDEHWILGDLVALGPEPLRVLETLAGLPAARVIRGNTDRYVFTGVDRPPPSMEDAARDPARLPALVECAGSFAWTQGALSRTPWLAWLEALPLEIRKTLPDGTRVLAVHAAPGRDDGLGILAGASHEDLLQAVEGCEADLVLAGHHHMPVDERAGDFHVVNLGSVSNPYAPDLRASYVLLEWDDDGHRVEHRRVDYDHQSVIDRMRDLRHPGANYVISHLAGERSFPLAPAR